MAHKAGPGRLTWHALLQVLLFVPTVLAFVLTVVGGATALVVVGIPILLAGLALLRWLADLHRGFAAGALGHPVPSTYRPTDGLPLLNRLATRAADPATWRDLAWTVYSATLGLVISLLVVLLALLVVTLVLWWFATPHLMALRSRLDASLLSRGSHELLEERVQVLTETRADSVESNAAELRRIERDLHDGAQARLVALRMHLGLASELVEADPDAARRLLDEASSASGAALGEIRDIVRGIHPPVLADRGLAGALEAVAIDMAVPVDLRHDLPGRLPAPVETALYFAVVECLANAAKHAAADHVWVDLRTGDGMLTAVVGDDGQGGADPAGTGLQGVARRLATFDGTVRVSSPTHGPTLVTLEVPCDSYWPRTTRSSGTD